MLHKFHLSVLNDYSQQYAQQVCNDFYADHQIATGEQILKLTSIPQVNLFVVSSLYEKWKADALAFKSPFFDFESTEVKEALTQFMNAVSRNIAVKRADLEPLLVEATKNTLVLLLDPNAYYNEIFRNQPSFSLTAEAFQHIKKYIRLNKFVADAVETHMEGRQFVFANQAIEWADSAIEKDSSQLESVEEWVDKFSEKVPLHTQTLIKKPIKVEPPKTIETPQNQSFFDKIEAIPAPSAEIIKPVEAKPIELPKIVVPTVENVKPVNETVNAANGNGLKESLNDSLRSEQATIYGNYQKQPIASIAQNVSLAQKFMFIHQLFAGSNSAYESAIEALEQAPDFTTAREMVTYKFASQYMWDMTSDTVADLIEIVKRRFGQN